VQGNVNGNRLVLRNAQEVRVQDFNAEWVTLQVFQNDGLGGAIDVQGQNGGVQSFVFQGFFQVLGDNAQQLRLFVTAVQDGRTRDVSAAYAAARTFPRNATHLSENHDCV